MIKNKVLNIKLFLNIFKSIKNISSYQIDFCTTKHYRIVFKNCLS